MLIQRQVEARCARAYEVDEMIDLRTLRDRPLEALRGSERGFEGGAPSTGAGQAGCENHRRHETRWQVKGLRFNCSGHHFEGQDESDRRDDVDS